MCEFSQLRMMYGSTFPAEDCLNANRTEICMDETSSRCCESRTVWTVLFSKVGLLAGDFRFYMLILESTAPLQLCTCFVNECTAGSVVFHLF